MGHCQQQPWICIKDEKKRERELKKNLQKNKIIIHMLFSSFSSVKVSRFVLPFRLAYTTTITKQQQLVFETIDHFFLLGCASKKKRRMAFFPTNNQRRRTSRTHTFFFLNRIKTNLQCRQLRNE
jgi:hypothetical protein